MSALLRIAAALLFAAISTCAGAQEYPTRVIRLIVPLTAGFRRRYRWAPHREVPDRDLASACGVENRPGAGGLIGYPGGDKVRA